MATFKAGSTENAGLRGMHRLNDEGISLNKIQ